MTTPDNTLTAVIFGLTITGTPAEFREKLAELDTAPGWTPAEKREAAAAIKAALKENE